MKKLERYLMAGTRNVAAAVTLAAGAVLFAGCTADIEPGPVGEQALGLTETGSEAAPGCAGVGCSLSGSVTLSADGGAVWLVEDGRRLCAGTLAEVQEELLAYEARLQDEAQEMIEEPPTDRNLLGNGEDHDTLLAPAYDPNPVPAGEAQGRIMEFSSASTSDGGEDGLKGPIPDPNPVPAVYVGVQIGSQDGASSSGDSDDDDPGGGPRFDLAMLTASLR